MKLFGSGYEEAMKLPKKRHVNKRYRKPFEKRNEDEEGYDASKDMGKDAVRRAVAEHKKNQAEEYAEKKKQGYAAMAEEAAKKKVGGKQRRAPAGPSDGRRKRAEIVKRVMAEKGCSMIEASKHVKAHGLY
jgi:hypothetical protein